MIVIVDSKRRVTLPKTAKAGDAFSVEMLRGGEILLKRVERGTRKVKLTREDGLIMASNGHEITMAETRAMMDEFP